MNIVYDHQIFCRQTHGGISRYVYELTSRLSALGANATIFAPLHINEYSRQADPRIQIGLWIPKFRGATLASRMVCAAFGNMLVRTARNIDIFHQTYYSKSSYAPRRAKKLVTVHDMIHEIFPESFQRGDQTSQIKRASVEWADHVICNSETTRSDLVRITGIAREKTSVVYLGHSLTAIQVGSRSQFSETLRPYLLYVGRRDGYKNFTRLLSAYADSSTLRRDFTLVCFGGGRPTENETNTIRHLGLEQCVVYTSGDDRKLSSLYSNATAFVYPSLYEGFGIPPLEAMAHDCPVICTNSGSVPEIVGNAGQLFNPMDVDEIREKIEHVVYSNGSRQQLITLGRRRIEMFSWQKCALETLRVYQHLIEGRNVCDGL